MTDMEQRARDIAEPIMLAVVNEWHRQVGIDEVMKTKLVKRIADTVATGVFEKHILAFGRAVEAEAIERAAKKAETFFDWCGPIGEYRNMAMAQSFAKECAAAIRALQDEQDTP